MYAGSKEHDLAYSNRYLTYMPDPQIAVSADERRAEYEAAQRLAKRYRLEFVDMDQFPIDQDLFRSIPADLMLRYSFVPFRRQGKNLVIVVPDPTDLPLLDELSQLLGTPITVTVGARSAIESILKKSESSQRVLEEATESFQIQLLKDDDNLDENLTVERLTSDISPVIKLVDSTIFTAIQRRASDIHIETGDDAVHVKYRIDGVLQPAMRPIAKQFHSPIISRIKVMAELDIAEKRVPQDGRFKLKVPGKTIDFRVSIMPSVHGEDAVIRILDKESISEQFRELRLDILGFPDTELKRFRKYIAEPYGMVLVTGPTGSGKTTTLYAALSEIKSVEDKIITIEDPVEYQLRGITQIPINEKKGLTFARGLRSILRHDPDKIMVGEIRDPETAQIAIQSALTGHLVFTTVHANNVIDVLGRFLNMGVEPYQFVSALNCVLAQRLVRIICAHCKRPVKVARTLLEESAMDPNLADTHTFYEGVGCIDCGGTGFKGRMAICELLDLTDSIREMILERRPSSEIKKTAHDEGMRFLRESAVEKVLQGATTLREINKVTFVDRIFSFRRAAHRRRTDHEEPGVGRVGDAPQRQSVGDGARDRAADGRCGDTRAEPREHSRHEIGGVGPAARLRTHGHTPEACRAGHPRHGSQGLDPQVRESAGPRARSRRAGPVAGAQSGAVPHRRCAAELRARPQGIGRQRGVRGRDGTEGHRSRIRNGLRTGGRTSRPRRSHHLQCDQRGAGRTAGACRRLAPRSRGAGRRDDGDSSGAAPGVFQKPGRRRRGQPGRHGSSDRDVL